MTEPETTFSVTHRFSFESAHQLPGHPTCDVVHGHGYRGEITVTARELSSQGFVVDFGVLKGTTARYDHAGILTRTAEQLAAEIGAAVLKSVSGQDNSAQVTGVEVVLWETPDGCARWSWRAGQS